VSSINKKLLSEQDIKTKYIMPAVEAVGWDKMEQIREEVTFTDGHRYDPSLVGSVRDQNLRQKEL
jgi:type I site-specific restriction endonuclease